MTPFAWLTNNFAANIGDGRATGYGTADGFGYLRVMSARLYPVALPIAIAAILSGPRYRPLLLAALANIVAHSLIGHKEYRFIWLSVFVIVVLAAIASLDGVERLRAHRGTSSRARGPAIAGLGLVWCGLSLLTYHSAGVSDFRDGGNLIRAALSADARPNTCGIGIASADRKGLAHVFLPRPVELYVIPDAMNEGREPFTPIETNAINAFVLSGGVAPPPPYRALGCEDDGRRRVCLYAREGGCTGLSAAHHRTYQQFLLSNGW